MRAESHPDTDLLGSLRDGVMQNAIDPNPGEQ